MGIAGVAGYIYKNRILCSRYYGEGRFKYFMGLKKYKKDL